MKKTKVYGWAADNAGCQSYRIRWPADAVNEMYGDLVEYNYGTVASPEIREQSEVVIGQRIVLPGPSHYWQQWAAEGSKRLVMDLDDDLWSVHESNLRASRVFNRPEYQDRMTANVLASDAVTVSTEPLKQSVHRNTGYPLDKIFVVPNAIPASVLRNRPDVHQIDARSTVGWMCSPTHKADAEMVGRYLRRFLESNSETTYHGIGADYAMLMKLPENQVKTTRWIASPEDAIASIDYRIGICPLTASTFNRSKSGCKFLETAARGVPTIVSDVAAYSEVQHGKTGLKVRYDHDWGKTLQKLYSDTGLQQKLADNAYDYVRSNRTTRHTAPQWLSAILGQRLRDSLTP